MTTTFRYGIALLAVIAALTLHLVFDPVLGASAPFFPVAILIAARFAGRGPGMAATALTTLFYCFFLIEPHYSFRIAELHDVVNLVALLSVGIVMSLLVGKS